MSTHKKCIDLIGKTVVFKKGIEDYCHGFEVGMKAILIGVEPADRNDFQLYFNFAKFEEYNKAFQTPNYYDDNHDPCLKWYQSLFYPPDKVDVIFCSEGVDLNEIFDVETT